VSPESIGKTAFLGVAWPRGAKLSPAGTGGATVGQNQAKLLPNEALWSIRRVEIGDSKRKFRFKGFDRHTL
jgi:hypothetical protein